MGALREQIRSGWAKYLITNPQPRNTPIIILDSITIKTWIYFGLFEWCSLVPKLPKLPKISKIFVLLFLIGRHEVVHCSVNLLFGIAQCIASLIIGLLFIDTKAWNDLNDCCLLLWNAIKILPKLLVCQFLTNRVEPELELSGTETLGNTFSSSNRVVISN